VKYFDYEAEDLDTGFDVEGFLEKSQKRNKTRLEQQLERIENQLEERDRIFEERRSGIQSKLDQRLEELEAAYRLSGDVEDVKQEIEELYIALDQVEQENWSDRQELEKERRELIRELDELSDPDLDRLF
jgi:DNA repair ATPase RecN